MVISRVYSGSPADKNGLQPGDRIEVINGRAISKVVDFIDFLDSVSSESQIHLLILRNSRKFHLALIQKD